MKRYHQSIHSYMLKVGSYCNYMLVVGGENGIKNCITSSFIDKLKYFGIVISNTIQFMITPLIASYSDYKTLAMKHNPPVYE